MRRQLRAVTAYVLLALLAPVLMACAISGGDAATVRIHTPTPPPTLVPEVWTPAPIGASDTEADVGRDADESEILDSQDDDAIEADDPPPPVAATLSTPSAPPPGSAADWAVDIPSIGVRSASIGAFGLTPAGVMEVPADHFTVAWYRFTAVPGEAGNAVFAAHVDWAGHLGVFNRLGELTPGGVITVTAPDGESHTYQVESVDLVDPDRVDVESIVGRRAGSPTLTLITCGGEFNRETRDYERRVIVRAVGVEAA